MAVEYNCPACGTPLDVTDPTVEIVCPSCGRLITPEVLSKMAEPPEVIPDPYSGSFASSEPPIPGTLDVTPVEPLLGGAEAFPLPDTEPAAVPPPPPAPGEPELLPPPPPAAELPPVKPTNNRTPWIIGGIVAIVLICLACACLAVLGLLPFFQISNFS